MTTTPIFHSFFKVGIIVLIFVIIVSIRIIIERQQEKRDKEWAEEVTKEWIEGEKDE